jgi:hypothetical protein
MFSLTPRFAFTHAGEPLREYPFAKLQACMFSCAGPERAAHSRLVRFHLETSYWHGPTKEMAAINTILIIVNSTVR